jgi:hypothetical protein
MSAYRSAPDGGFPIASPSSTVELIPVISLGIEGVDIPRPLNCGQATTLERGTLNVSAGFAIGVLCSGSPPTVCSTA